MYIREIDRNYFAVDLIALPRRLLANSRQYRTDIEATDASTKERTNKNADQAVGSHRCEKDEISKISTYAITADCGISFEHGLESS